MSLDVALRLRLLNELSNPAKVADGDLQRLARSMQRLNGKGGGTQLAQGLRQADQAASRADRSINRIGRSRQPMQAVATGAHNLSTSLDRVATAATRAERATGRMMRQMPVAAGGAHGRFAPSAAIAGGGGLSAGSSMALGATAARFAGRFVGPLSAVYTIMKASDASEKLERAMYDVQRATDDSGKALDAHKDKILELSRETGKAATELAGMWAAGGFAGRPKEDLARFTAYAAKATTAWGTNAEETGQAMAEIGNIFKANQDRIEEIGDAVNTAADTGAAAESDLLEFLRRGSKFGNVMKMSAEEIIAFGSAFKEVGVRTEVAATGFDAFVRKLALAGEQNGDFKDAVKDIGFSTRAIEKGMRTNAADTIVTVLEAVARAKDPIKVLAGLGGGEYADDFAALMGQLPKLKEYLALMRDPRNYKGSVQKGFLQALDKDFNKADRMNRAIETLGIRAADVWRRAYGEIALEVVDMVDSVEKGDTALQKLISRWEGYYDAKARAEGRVDEKGMVTINSPGQEAEAAVEGWAERNLPWWLIPKEANRRLNKYLGGTSADAAREGRRDYLQERLDKENAILKQPEAIRRNAKLVGSVSPEMDEFNRLLIARAEIEAQKVRIQRSPFGLGGPKMEEQDRTGSGPVGKAEFLPVADIGRQMQFELVAQDSMNNYNRELSAGTVNALRIAQEAAARIMTALSFNATPTIEPRIVAPGVSAPVSAAPAPQKGKGKTASRGGITVGTVIVNGVTNLAGLEREISRAADRTARNQRDNALHATGALA